MGVDEVLLASASAGGDPALRLYRWDGPWLSLGYGQKTAGTLVDACRRANVGIVRRATGGGAVLHGRDLTYAVAAPADTLPGGLDAGYQQIGGALLRAILLLGIRAERMAPGEGAARARGFDRFAAPADHEICVGGRKLAGSAQRRSSRAFLQHGSLRLEPDPPAAARATGLAPGRATSLAETGYRGGPDRVGAAIERAIAEVLGADLQPSTLSPEERKAARQRSCLGLESPRSCPVGAPGASSRERMDSR